jgi:FkbM family methyltransferase
MKQLIHKTLRTFGLDVIRYPVFSSLEKRLPRLMADHGIDLVLDVGANVGQFAGFLRRSGYKGQIVSFEPVKTTYLALEVAAAADPLWNIYRLALGSREGEAMINVMEGSTLSSLYQPSDYGQACFADEVVSKQESVKLARLDSFLTTEELKAKAGAVAQRRIFLKIDTQGHDLEVFKGAEAILDSVVLLLMELSVRPIYRGTPDWLQGIQEVQSRGFVLYDLFPIIYDKEAAIIEYDGLFLKRGK